MSPQKKITVRQQTEEQQQAVNEQQSQQAVREFANVEEMLRHDALHTPVPPAIGQRLQQSVEQLPAPQRRAWWRKLFGG